MGRGPQHVYFSERKINKEKRNIDWKNITKYTFPFHPSNKYNKGNVSSNKGIVYYFGNEESVARNQDTASKISTRCKK